ncbi:MAG: DUF2155 domain-containing protein [Planktotalea arctica]
MTKFFAALSIACFCALPVSGQQAVLSGSGADIRVLDTVSGQSTNYTLASGASLQIGQLTVALRACRYPEGAPSNDAFAFFDISETETAAAIFNGWMVASSPALNAMEHSRYDVWVLRCKIS